MMRVLLLLIVTLTLTFPALGQDEGEQITEASPAMSLIRGKAEFIDVDKAYLLIGDKVELSLQSDYYQSEGTLDLEEGSWSLIAAGIERDDRTTYGGRDFSGADIELRASPSRCLSILNIDSAKAFRISCPLRSLRFEIRSNSSKTLLLITQLTSANTLSVTLTATITPTSTLTFTPTNTPTNTLTFTPTHTPSITPTPTITPTSTLTFTPSITPTDLPTNTPTPSRTPRPTVDPDAGTWHIIRSGGVNVRSCASTSCSIVAQYQYGRNVEVVGLEIGQAVGGNTRWAKTSDGNFIHVSLLNRGARPPTVTPTPRPVVKREPTVAPWIPSNLEELILGARAAGADRTTIQYLRDVHEAWGILGYVNMSVWWEYLYGMASFFKAVYEGCELTYELISSQQVKALMLSQLNSVGPAPDPAFPRDFIFDGYASILYNLHC